MRSCQFIAILDNNKASTACSRRLPAKYLKKTCFQRLDETIKKRIYKTEFNEKQGLSGPLPDGDQKNETFLLVGA